MNDLPDEPLAFDSYIYLEKKNSTGQKDKHTVQAGETLLLISQAEGIQLKKLAALNLLNTFEQPVVGAVLELKTVATTKPAIEDYKDKPIPVLENTTVTTTEEVSFGMSFEAPADNAKKIAIENTYKELKKESDENTPPVSVVVPEKSLKDNIKENPETIEEEQPKRKSGIQYYIVKKGETAFSIAKRNDITVQQLENWNAIKAQKLKAGQKIIVKK
jgi:LysM repeat protein